MLGSNAMAVIWTTLAFGYVVMFALVAAGWLMPRDGKADESDE